MKIEEFASILESCGYLPVDDPWIKVFAKQLSKKRICVSIIYGLIHVSVDGKSFSTLDNLDTLIVKDFLIKLLRIEDGV